MHAESGISRQDCDADRTRRAANSILRRIFARITHDATPTATPQRPTMTRHRSICEITQRPRNMAQNQRQTPKTAQSSGQFQAGFALGENFIGSVPHDHHRPSILADFRRKPAVLSHLPLQGQAIDAPPPIVFSNPSDHRRTKPAVGIVKQDPAHAENLTRQCHCAIPNHI